MAETTTIKLTVKKNSLSSLLKLFLETPSIFDGMHNIIMTFIDSGADLKEISNQLTLFAVQTNDLLLINYLHQKGCITVTFKQIVGPIVQQNLIDMFQFLGSKYPQMIDDDFITSVVASGTSDLFMSLISLPGINIKKVFELSFKKPAYIKLIVNSYRSELTGQKELLNKVLNSVSFDPEGKLEMYQLLIDLGADQIDPVPLVDKIITTSSDEIATYLLKNLSINQLPINIIGLATLNEKTNLALMAINKGCDLDARTYYDESSNRKVMTIALAKKNFIVTKALVEAGATYGSKVEVVTGEGLVDFIKLLVDNRQKIEFNQDKINNALNGCFLGEQMTDNHYECARLLIEAGANINSINDYSKQIYRNHFNPRNTKKERKLAEGTVCVKSRKLINIGDQYLLCDRSHPILVSEKLKNCPQCLNEFFDHVYVNTD